MGAGETKAEKVACVGKSLIPSQSPVRSTPRMPTLLADGDERPLVTTERSNEAETTSENAMTKQE